MAVFEIRDARLPDERAQLVEFIMASQRYEHAIEPDRRLDAPVGDEHFDVLMSRLAKKPGRIFVADDGSSALLGWAVVHEDENDLYVVAEERRYGYVAELLVAEPARGKGVGRALLAACDSWARSRQLHVMMIGVLSGNMRAAKVYADAGFSPYSVQLRKSL